MNHSPSLLGRCLLALVLGCSALQAQADAARPPIADFFDNPAFSGALLSPNGAYLAVRIAGANSRDKLAVIELATQATTVVAYYTDADIGQVSWISDERLVFNTTDRKRAMGEKRFGPGLYAVNRDGSAMRQLVARGYSLEGRGAAKLLPGNTSMLRDPGQQDSSSIYVTSPKFDAAGQFDHTDLLRLNTLTGRTESVDGPPGVRSWMLDQRGEPRLAIAYDKQMQITYYRDPATAAWRKLLEVDRYRGGQGNFAPMQFGPDGTLYVRAHKGKDKSAIFSYDLASGKISDKPLIEVAGFDVQGHFISGHDKLLGLDYLADAEAVTWFDAGMQAVQKEVDALLPHTVNILSVAARGASPMVLVRAYSDLQPSRYFLFNSSSHALTHVGDAHPTIQPAQMGSMELVHYRARDGLDIPAYVTHPAQGGKKLPMVVLVHGGPFVHGTSWGWEAESQFLASRGYLVLEPAYRGTTGYGSKHFRAGWKQWGLAMQDDIADGVKWAVAQGLADPGRVCIAGASYGGYATLMGLINDPQLYQCGVNWVGVTDLSLLHDGHWWYESDISDEYRQYGMPMLVGDPVKDAAQFTATSPLLQAARIKQPLLMAYGGSDVRVPVIHGIKFHDAIKATNAQVEWVVYPEEGHGWALPKNRIDFWSRVEQFLDRNIGPGKTAAPGSH